MIQEPPAIRRLPKNKAGYRVPWFVAYIDGQPDFRVVRTNGIGIAHTHRICWICGESMSAYKTFAIGPMCIVNRVSAEPPMHRDCARYSARVCPFLTRPSMRRRDVSDVEGHIAPAGVMVDRNPGVVALWTTRTYKLIRADAGMDGVLFQLGEPTGIEWFAEGRQATREEVQASIDSGLPLLEQACEQDDDPAASRANLALMVNAAYELLPV